MALRGIETGKEKKNHCKMNATAAKGIAFQYI